jgi:hypothetical protein
MSEEELVSTVEQPSRVDRSGLPQRHMVFGGRASASSPPIAPTCGRSRHHPEDLLQRRSMRHSRSAAPASSSSSRPPPARSDGPSDALMELLAMTTQPRARRPSDHRRDALALRRGTRSARSRSAGSSPSASRASASIASPWTSAAGQASRPRSPGRDAGAAPCIADGADELVIVSDAGRARGPRLPVDRPHWAVMERRPAAGGRIGTRWWWRTSAVQFGDMTTAGTLTGSDSPDEAPSA